MKSNISHLSNLCLNLSASLNLDGGKYVSPKIIIVDKIVTFYDEYDNTYEKCIKVKITGDQSEQVCWSRYYD